jgi:hypothetical protein
LFRGGGVESGGVSEFELFLLFFAFFSFAAFVLFVGFATFSPLDDLHEPFFVFWSSSCASRVLDSKFKLWAFVVIVLIKWEIEKPSGQYLGLIVMSH